MLDLSHPGSGEGTGHASVKPGAPARPGSLQVTDLGLDRQSVTTIPLATPTPSGNKGLRWAPSPNPSDSTDSSPRAASGPDSGLLTLTKTQMDGGGGVSELEQESRICAGTTQRTLWEVEGEGFAVLPASRLHHVGY